MKILNNFLVLDTETTGLEDHDQVVELAILDEYGSTLYHSLFTPDVPFHPIARKVNRISNKELANAPRFIDEWPKIKAILQHRTVLGHNIATFDIRLIRQTLLAQGADSHCLDDVFHDVLDSLILAKNLGQKELSQEKLAQAYGICEPEKHRAIADCQQLLQIVQAMEEAYCEQFYALFKLQELHKTESETPKKKQGRKYGNRVDACCELVKGGKTVQEICDFFGYTSRTIARYLADLVFSGHIERHTAITLLMQHNAQDNLQLWLDTADELTDIFTEYNSDSFKQIMKDEKSLHTAQWSSMIGSVSEEFWDLVSFIQRLESQSQK